LGHGFLVSYSSKQDHDLVFDLVVVKMLEQHILCDGSTFSAREQIATMEAGLLQA
jgi:hypothetical protein